MNEQEGRRIVEGLRQAQRAGAPVEELLGKEARKFVFVEDVAVRPILLGSFSVRVPGILPFFVSLVVKARKPDDFQCFIMDKKRGSPVLGTSVCTANHLRWRYSPTKQSGDNAARKRAFVEQNGSDTVDIPLPGEHVRPFAEAVQKAILARRTADGLENTEPDDDDDDDDEEEEEAGADDAGSILADLRSWYSQKDLADAAAVMTSIIREVHAVAPDRWSITRRADRRLLRLNVGTVRVFDLSAQSLFLAIKTDELSSQDRTTLGSKLDTDDPLAVSRFGPNGVVVAAPADMAALLPRLQPGFRSLLAAAGKTAPMHQRHHEPAVLEALRTLTTEALPEPAIPAGRLRHARDVEPGDAGPVAGRDFNDILAHLASRSLAFPVETVATYLLALQTRRFVLLTGISGTGKTQLALEVARLLSPPSAASSATSVPHDGVELVIQTDHMKRGRFVVPVRLAKQLDALYNEQTNRLDVRLPGRPAESMSIYKDSGRPGLLMVGLSGDGKLEFQRAFTVGTRVRLRRETTATSEMLVVEHIEAGQEPVTGVAHELIAVRPDWTDARALFGFYNPLTKTYVSTPTVDLLRAAAAEVERAASTNVAPRPYFLVFDEMNLARVEHYFSDFLSAMESGEAVHLHDDDELAEQEDGAVPRKIAIPGNVFIVGTVNVDETTYMFSPKVLDRAFVIEFNHVDLDMLGPGGPGADEDTAASVLSLTKLEGGLRLRGKPDGDEWTRFVNALAGELYRRLKTIHAALAVDNRHFGYRVAREIARFVDLAGKQTSGGPEALHAAFDAAVFGKILPRLHGAQAELEGPLRRLFDIAAGAAPADTREGFVANGTTLTRRDGSAVPMPRTAFKLWRMQARLRAHGFVSFID